MKNQVERDLTKAIELINKALQQQEGSGRTTTVDVRTTTSSSGRGRQSKSAVANAARMYRSGKSVNDVAQKLGVSYPTARRMIVDSGVDIRDRNERVAARRSRAA